MENNSALVIDSLLSKFGTTIEHLMPAIIDFGRYECKLTIRVCSYLIITGIIFMAVSYLVNRNCKSMSFTLETWMDIFFVTGIVMIIICVFIIILALATLNKWNTFPEIMAYKYILGCIH